MDLACEQDRKQLESVPSAWHFWGGPGLPGEWAGGGLSTEEQRPKGLKHLLEIHQQGMLHQ
jgi:hypothetical protein